MRCQWLFFATSGAICLPLETKTSTGDDHVSEVVSNRFQRVPLGHCPDVAQFAPSFLAIICGDELDALHERHIGPVDAIGIVAVIRLDQIVEDLLLIIGHGMDWVVGAAHVRPMRGSWPVVLDVGHIEGRRRGCRYGGTSRVDEVVRCNSDGSVAGHPGHM